MFIETNQENIESSQNFVHGLHIDNFENYDDSTDALSISGCVEKLVLEQKTAAFFSNADKVRSDLFRTDCHLTIDQRTGKHIKSLERKYFVDCTEFLITLIRPVVSLDDVSLFEKYDVYYPKDFIYYVIREFFHRAYDLHNVYTTCACACLVKRLGLIYDLIHGINRSVNLSPVNYIIEFVRVLGGDVLVTDTSLGFYRIYSKIENDFCEYSAQSRQSGFWASALNLFTSWFSGAKCDVDPQAQGIEMQVIGPHYVNGEGKEIDGYYIHTNNPEMYAIKTLAGMEKQPEVEASPLEAQAETKGFFSGIVSSCSRLIHSFVSGTTDMTNKIVSKIKDFTNMFTNLDLSYLKLIKYGAISLVAVVIITLLLTLINTGILTHAYLSRKRVLDAQDKDNSSFITGVCKIVAAVTGWNMGLPITRINGNMTFAGTFGRSVEAVTKWMIALMPVAVLKCFGISNECLEVFSENQALADDLLSKTSVPGVTQLPGYIESMKKLLYYFKEVYMSEKDGGSYPKNYYRQASFYVKTISKKLAEIQGVRYHNTIKNPSLLVYVSGDTGVAKSTLFHQLMQDPQFTGKLKTCTGENVPPRVYSRTTEDEYWSGYQPKTYGCTVIDEAFNLSDAELYKVESQVLHLTGASAYLLPMADISDSSVGKKGTGYDSNITVLIGNTTSMSSESYHREGCYTSLTRRVNCEINVRIADKYKRFYNPKTGLDLEGLRKHLIDFCKYSPTEADNRLARYEHAEFVVKNFDLKSTVVGKVYSYSELRDELIKRHNAMTNSVSRLVDFSGYMTPFDALEGFTKAFVEENKVEMLEKSVRVDPNSIGFEVEALAKAENYKYNDLDCISFNNHDTSMELLQYSAGQKTISREKLPPYEVTVFDLAYYAMRRRNLDYTTEFEIWNKTVSQLDLCMRAFIGAPTTIIRVRVLRSMFWILSPYFKDFNIYTEKEFAEYKPLIINYCHSATQEELKGVKRSALKNFKEPVKKHLSKAWQFVWYKVGGYYIARIIKVPIERNGWIQYTCLNDCYSCIEQSIDSIFGLYEVPEGKHLKPLEYVDRIAYRLRTKFAIDLYTNVDPIGDGEDSGVLKKIANAALAVVGVSIGFAGIFYAAKKIVTAFTTWFADDNKDLARKEFECQNNGKGYDYKDPPPEEQNNRDFDYGYDERNGGLWYQGDGLQTIRLRVDGHEINALKVYEKWVLTYSHSRFRHLLSGESQSLPVVFKSNDKEFCAEVTAADIKTAGTDILVNDILFVRINIPQFSPAANNVWKKFISSDTLNTLSESARFPVKVTTADNRKMYSFGSIVDSVPYAGPDNLSYVLNHAVRYNMNTRDGDCGTPVIGLIAGKHSVIGIHVAGNEFDEVGVCNIVTQNTIRKVLDIPCENEDAWVAGKMMRRVGNAGIVDLNAQSDELPNLVSVERLPKDAASFQPKVNSMVKTQFAGHPDWYPAEKAPSLPMDAVCEDGTPVKEVMIREMGEFKQPEKLDDAILDRIFREAVSYYSKQVKKTGIAWRKFDPDQAVKGTINLAPMDMNTSPGYPWNKLKPGSGKRGCINHVEGKEILYNLEYFNCLEETLKIFNNNGSIDDVPFGNIFICNWKQELLKLAKIVSGRTRSINCSSLHISHAMRMEFGCLLEMLNNMKGESAIGLDPHSPEFHNRVYVHLCRARPEGKGFIAGDYKAFDKHYVREILDLAFEVLYELVPEGFCTPEQWKFFKDSQTNPKLIIGRKMYKFHTLQYSGCLLTTCLNNLINRLYISYCYYHIMGVNTKQSFDNFVTGIYMGDDHLLYVKPAVREQFNQVTLSTAMLRLNQEYTDDKKSEVVDPFQDFEDCTFMGCTPRLIGNVYYGALRKSTLQNNVTYIQNGESLLTILDCFINHAAVWGDEYFKEYTAKVRKVIPGFKIGSRENCLRTFTRKINLKAQSPAKAQYFKAQSDEIVEFVDEEEGEAEETEEMLVPIEIDSTALADTAPQDYHTGMNSWLLKGVFSWDSSQQRGAVLYQTATSEPWSLLSLNANDLQSLGVRNFQYWRGTVEIKFTLNCVPSQGGALIVSSYPLAQDIDAYTGINSTLYMPHGILSPVDKSTSYIISHPFTYPMPYAECNIDSTNVNYPVLFKISARVLSQLTGSAPNATLSVYMRIKDCELKVPRNPELSNLVAQSMEFKPLEVPKTMPPPLPDSFGGSDEKPKPRRFTKRGPRNRGYGRRRGFGKGHGNKQHGSKGAPKKTEAPPPAVPDKGSMPENVNNQQEKELAKEGKYKSEKKGTKFYPSRKLRKELATLDQEKVKGALKKVGGGLFYKAANTVLKNKTGISLDELLNLFNAFDREKIIELTTHIQNQYQSMSNGVGPFKVTSLQLNPNADYHIGRALIAPEDIKISELTSPFCFFKFFNWSTTNQNESTVAAFPLRSDLGYIQTAGNTSDVPMNMAFVHAFMYFKCTFVFRVYVFKSCFHSGRLRATIGYGITQSQTEQSQGITYSHILDFTNNYVAEFEVPFRIPTEWMVTYGGPEPYLKYMIEQGWVIISVANSLVNIGETTSGSVECAIAVSYKDCCVAVPRPVPLCTGNTNDQRYYLTAQDMDEHDAEQDEDAVVECNHFEFRCEDMLTYWRRMYQYPDSQIQMIKGSTIGSLSTQRIRFLVRPWNMPMSEFFNSFSGSLNFRVVFYNASEVRTTVKFFPIETEFSHNDVNVTTQRCYGAPTEIPASTNVTYVLDFNVPYQKVESFLTKQNPILGVVEITRGGNDTYSSVKPQVFMGLGDDAQFGMRCVPTGGVVARKFAKSDESQNVDGVYVPK